jgi:hypothetical protein
MIMKKPYRLILKLGSVSQSPAGEPLLGIPTAVSFKMTAARKRNASTTLYSVRRHYEDITLSLIETCELNKANVFDYLVTVMNNSRAVRAQPALWLPWNYQLQKAA